ncbi:MAG TPA: response regulator transcription factor [Acidimicrobiales bacterium]|nr:response regulator transcription factor [Acidimicrobiales bacterium]
MKVRVFLVDDHEVVRFGLRQMIDAEEDLVVVGEAATTIEALELVPVVKPDVAVLDVQLEPGSDGIELCRELRARHANLVTIMLSSFGDDETILAAMMAGASGYALKQLKGPALVDSIRRVAAHEVLFDPEQRERLLEQMRASGREDADPLRRLTVQEERILDLVAVGHTNRQIAQKLFLSEKTVKNYVSNVLRKLGMQRRTEAAVYATRRARLREGATRGSVSHVPSEIVRE